MFVYSSPKSLHKLKQKLTKSEKKKSPTICIPCIYIFFHGLLQEGDAQIIQYIYIVFQ